MKLVTALHIGKECALKTVDDAIYNIRIHAMNIFTYGEEQNEYSEIIRDYKLAVVTHGINSDTSIDEALSKLEV